MNKMPVAPKDSRWKVAAAPTLEDIERVIHPMDGVVEQLRQTLITAKAWEKAALSEHEQMRYRDVFENFAEDVFQAYKKAHEAAGQLSWLKNKLRER
jgi:hypothetical protein